MRGTGWVDLVEAEFMLVEKACAFTLGHEHNIRPEVIEIVGIFHNLLVLMGLDFVDSMQ